MLQMVALINMGATFLVPNKF